MNCVTATVTTILLVSLAACARRVELRTGDGFASIESTLVGQVTLPAGSGSRGVEVQVLVSSAGDTPQRSWVLFDERGRFSHRFRGSLTRVEVSAGVVVHRIDAGELLDMHSRGRIDVGVIDLRDRLKAHRLMLRAADGKPGGDVRVGMWVGLPPVGPRGESVSLGSRQFPPIALGSAMEWLLPRDTQDLYFLVERPADAARGKEWRSGRQQLFGPFPSKGVPSEFVVD